MNKKEHLIKSELINLLADKQEHLDFRDIEYSVNSILEQISKSLESGERVEIRGFGTFSLHHRPAKMGRNPRTGQVVSVPGKHVPFFKPGRMLSEKVDGQFQKIHLLK